MDLSKNFSKKLFQNPIMLHEFPNRSIKHRKDMLYAIIQGNCTRKLQMPPISSILYSFRRCPYAMRARLALHYGNCSFEHREILLKDKPKSLLQYSSKGTVPVFIHDKEVIDESLDIMLWSLDHLKLCSPLKIAPDKHGQALALIKMNDTHFKRALDRYKYGDKMSASVQEQTKAWEDCLHFFKILENHLSNNAYLFGERQSFADFAIFPFVRQCARCDENRFAQSGFSHLLQWLEKLTTLPLFETVMEKHPIYEE